MTNDDLKKDALNQIWRGICNYQGSIPGKIVCQNCPFKNDSELCYDSEDYNYEKFEKWLIEVTTEHVK